MSLKKFVKKNVGGVVRSLNPWSAVNEKLTGMAPEKMTAIQLAAGAGAVGAGALMSRPGAAGIPGLQGGPPLANGVVSGGSAGGLFSRFNPWSFLAPVLGAGVDIWSARQTAEGQHEANQMTVDSARERMAFEDAQATRQMDFQERMSNTAVQRRMADLKAAGINPVLAGQEGAAVPVGASASGDSVQYQNEAPDYRGVVGKGISTAIQLKQMKKDFEQIDSSIALNVAAAERERSVGLNSRVSAMEGMEAVRSARARADMDEMVTNYARRNSWVFKSGQFIKAFSPFATSARDISGAFK